MQFEGGLAHLSRRVAQSGQGTVEPFVGMAFENRDDVLAGHQHRLQRPIMDVFRNHPALFVGGADGVDQQFLARCRQAGDLIDVSGLCVDRQPDRAAEEDEHHAHQDHPARTDLLAHHRVGGDLESEEHRDRRQYQCGPSP